MKRKTLWGGLAVLLVTASLHVTAWAAPKISAAQANAIALKRVPGKVMRNKLERDDGRDKYEIVIRTNRNVWYEVEVDGHTGNIRDVDRKSGGQRGGGSRRDDDDD